MRRFSPSNINQALAALALLYQHSVGIRIDVKRARTGKPAEPDALSRTQENAFAVPLTAVGRVMP